MTHMKIYKVPKDLVLSDNYRKYLSDLHKQCGFLLEWVSKTEYILYDVSSTRRIEALLDV